MSYIVSIKRLISKSDLLMAIDGDDEFAILSKDDNDAELVWTVGEERTTFYLAQGEIIATTPSDKAWEKMHPLAERLNAVVIGEENDLPTFNEVPIWPEVKQGIFANRATWMGWPILVVVLLALLIWRW